MPTEHEKHEYREDCPGCRPRLVDLETNRPLDDNSEAMAIVMKLWNALPIDDRRACNRVWVFNSRAKQDRAVARRIGRLLATALKEYEDAKALITVKQVGVA